MTSASVMKEEFKPMTSASKRKKHYDLCVSHQGEETHDLGL
jgi:hypothetical protein